MKRTQIYLSSEQTGDLDRVARASGKTRSQVIREAIDNHLSNAVSAEQLEQALRESFGAWTCREEDGAQFVERLRRGGRLSRLYPER